jgi:hypothetical protein
MSDLTQKDITAEAWREYDIPGRPSPYRIENPVALYLRAGGTTHRVVDATGLVHCPPAPSAGNGVVLRWQPKDPASPVQF